MNIDYSHKLGSYLQNSVILGNNSSKTRRENLAAKRSFVNLKPHVRVKVFS
jgi:hypothetical protein